MASLFDNNFARHRIQSRIRLLEEQMDELTKVVKLLEKELETLKQETDEDRRLRIEQENHEWAIRNGWD